MIMVEGVFFVIQRGYHTALYTIYQAPKLELKLQISTKLFTLLNRHFRTKYLNIPVYYSYRDH